MTLQMRWLVVHLEPGSTLKLLTFLFERYNEDLMNCRAVLPMDLRRSNPGLDGSSVSRVLSAGQPPEIGKKDPKILQSEANIPFRINTSVRERAQNEPK